MTDGVTSLGFLNKNSNAIFLYFFKENTSKKTFLIFFDQNGRHWLSA